MGMSMHGVGVRDLDGKFDKMMQIKKLCEQTGVSYPPEVEAYFKFPEESEDFLRQEMESVQLSLREWKDDCREGYEIDVKDLPEEVKTIRFYCSW